MRAVFIAVFAVGLGLAGFAAYMIKDQFTAYQAALEAERNANRVETEPAFIVTRDIAYGEEIQVEDLRVVPFPVEASPEGLFRTEEQLLPQGRDVLRSATRSMLANEVVLASKVTEPGQPAGVASRLTEGKRAFAISVDVATGVSGFLRPNDRVDVYWTGAFERGDEVTKLIDTNVRIVAIDQSADEERAGATVARTVTVEATPRQVAALAQAQSTGRLSLSLVGSSDGTIAEAIEIDQRELLGIEEEVRVEVEEAEECSIRTRRGADVVEIPIPCS